MNQPFVKHRSCRGHVLKNFPILKMYTHFPVRKYRGNKNSGLLGRFPCKIIPRNLNVSVFIIILSKPVLLLVGTRNIFYRFVCSQNLIQFFLKVSSFVKLDAAYIIGNHTRDKTYFLTYKCNLRVRCAPCS